MCATSWCDLDLTFDLAYLMLFYVSTRISDTIYLSYISLISFYLNIGCCTLALLKSYPQILPQFHIKACIATSVCMGNIQNIQTIIRPYK